MDSLPAEARVILALEAIRKSTKLSIREAAKIYTVPATTIRRRRDGHTIRRDTALNSRKLTKSEEEAII